MFSANLHDPARFASGLGIAGDSFGKTASGECSLLVGYCPHQAAALLPGLLASPDAKHTSFGVSPSLSQQPRRAAARSAGVTLAMPLSYPQQLLAQPPTAQRDYVYVLAVAPTWPPAAVRGDEARLRLRSPNELHLFAAGLLGNGSDGSRSAATVYFRTL